MPDGPAPAVADADPADGEADDDGSIVGDKSRSGLGDDSVPSLGSGTDNSPNAGTDNPNQAYDQPGH